MEFDKNKIKLKIAISKIKEENDIVMENKSKKIFKIVSTAVVGIVLSTGIVFAGTKVYEKIWKDPEKIEIVTTVLTPEAQKENINEEEAKQIAVNKLKEIGFNTNIVKSDNYKEVDSNKIMYRFITDDDYSISIDGQNAVFYDIWNESKKLAEIDKNFWGYGSGKNMSSEYFMNKDKAVEVANKYYKLFGFKEGEYEVTKVRSYNSYGDETAETGYKFDVNYNKKYGDIYNPYEHIAIQVYAKDEMLWMVRTENIPYDNNPIKITKEDAIQIALEVDKKIETNKVVETKAESRIVKINADAYDRIKDKNKHYEAMQTVDYPMEERNYYYVEDKVRNAWIVVITYEDNFGDDTVKRYTEGEYSYFVDCTTGEIIGGATMDYLYSTRGE